MKHLEVLAADKKLAPALSVNFNVLEKRKNVPLRLMSAIMGQQLSTRVAKIIYDRFINLFDGREPSPHQVLKLTDEQLRSIGLSNAKVQYVKNVAAFWTEHALTDAAFEFLDNDEIIDLLTQIKGVGRWTVEMLLMFTLGREDVFAVDDLGIQKAMTALYKLEQLPIKERKEKMIKLSKKWHPYQSYACLYLWNWKDTAPLK